MALPKAHGRLDAARRLGEHVPAFFYVTALIVLAYLLAVIWVLARLFAEGPSGSLF
jgi:hypothetical protein